MEKIRLVIIAHALRAGGGISVGQNVILSVKKQFPDAQCLASIPAGLGFEDTVGRVNIKYFSFMQSNWGQQWIYENIQLPRLVNAFHPDFVLSLANRALPKVTAPQIMLLHDSHLFYPEKHYHKESIKRKLLKRFQKCVLAKDLRKVNTLLIQTKTAEERVREQYDFSGDSLLLPNAVSKKVHLNIKYDPPEAYLPYADKFKLFYLTRYYPHKNIELIIKAFENFPGPMDGFHLFLTIDGHQHPGAKQLLRRIDERGLSHKITNIGPLPQEKLGKYFTHCDALVMPTTLESFSATYLEAMAFGVPIVTSDLDFSREICGDSALYFNPWSAKSLCSTLIRARENPQLLRQLIEKARQRLTELQWTWDANGARVAQLIRKQVSLN